MPPHSSVSPTSQNHGRGTAPADLEIKDAQIIFDSVWSELEEEFGRENLRFPKETFWLNGAPGAGKGTQTRFIQEFRDLTAPPVVISTLLTSPEAKKLIDSGQMVGDREVTSLLIRELLKPIHQSGAMIDGYPRTKVQVECLKLFYNKLMELRREFAGTDLSDRFPKPMFHVVVLFIDEGESVARQIKRGEKARLHNEQVDRSGVGEKIEVRKTDLTEEAARNRYRTFKEVTYESLKSLRQVFHYHFVNAAGTIEEVQRRIVRELAYQSSLELEEPTFDRLSSIPIASSMSVHARQELVKRLDDYEKHHNELFRYVVETIRDKFIPIVTRHAISGMAMINSEDNTFGDPMALSMLIDIFSERGYHATVDVQREYVPVSLDLETGHIENQVKRVYRFVIRFPGSEIRRGR